MGDDSEIGTWRRRAKGRGKAHKVSSTSVSRASQVIGYWMECGRHMASDGMIEATMADFHGYCRQCLGERGGS